MRHLTVNLAIMLLQISYPIRNLQTRTCHPVPVSILHWLHNFLRSSLLSFLPPLLSLLSSLLVSLVLRWSWSMLSAVIPDYTRQSSLRDHSAYFSVMWQGCWTTFNFDNFTFFNKCFDRGLLLQQSFYQVGLLLFLVGSSEFFQCSQSSCTFVLFLTLSSCLLPFCLLPYFICYFSLHQIHHQINSQ